MKDCNECELAVYCYSEPDTWTFRTKEQMLEIMQKMEGCETYRKLNERLGSNNQAADGKTDEERILEDCARTLSRG